MNSCLGLRFLANINPEEKQQKNLTLPKMHRSKKPTNQQTSKQKAEKSSNSFLFLPSKPWKHTLISRVDLKKSLPGSQTMHSALSIILANLAKCVHIQDHALCRQIITPTTPLGQAETVHPVFLPQWSRMLWDSLTFLRSRTCQVCGRLKERNLQS